MTYDFAFPHSFDTNVYKFMCGGYMQKYPYLLRQTTYAVKYILHEHEHRVPLVQKHTCVLLVNMEKKIAFDCTGFANP